MKWLFALIPLVILNVIVAVYYNISGTTTVNNVYARQVEPNGLTLLPTGWRPPSHTEGGGSTDKARYCVEWIRLNVNQLHKVQATLIQQGLTESQIQSTEMLVRPDDRYWVAYEPEATPEKTIVLSNQMKQKGFDNRLVVPSWLDEPALNGYIALGFFHSKQAAGALIERLSVAGYRKTGIRILRRSALRYGLTLTTLTPEQKEGLLPLQKSLAKDSLIRLCSDPMPDKIH